MDQSDFGGQYEFVRWKPDRDRLSYRREREVLLRKLYEAEQMRSVGELAAGTAHDLANVLCVIKMSTEFLTANVQAEHRPDLEQISAAANRGISIVKQLHSIARGQTEVASEVGLDRLVKDIATLLEAAAGPGYEITLDLEDGLWPIDAVAGQLEQVIINLVMNARDAMPEGGTIALVARNLPPDEAKPRESDLSGSVVLTVRDQGHGMTRETKERLFEPFFTTKGPAKGTGLGLWMTKAIVERFGGRVSVRSTLGSGTDVRILFPRGPHDQAA